MNFFQLIQSIKNPQQLLQQMSSNPQFTSNPIIQNSIKMAQNGDSKGIEEMARNLCKEKGINELIEAVTELKREFSELHLYLGGIWVDEELEYKAKQCEEYVHYLGWLGSNSRSVNGFNDGSFRKKESSNWKFG